MNSATSHPVKQCREQYYTLGTHVQSIKLSYQCNNAQCFTITLHLGVKKQLWKQCSCSYWYFKYHFKMWLVNWQINNKGWLCKNSNSKLHYTQNFGFKAHRRHTWNLCLHLISMLSYKCRMMIKHTTQYCRMNAKATEFAEEERDIKFRSIDYHWDVVMIEKYDFEKDVFDTFQ